MTKASILLGGRVGKQVLFDAAMSLGEALVSVLNAQGVQGVPTPVERILMYPLESQIGPINDTRRTEIIHRSPYNVDVRGKVSARLC